MVKRFCLVFCVLCFLLIGCKGNSSEKEIRSYEDVQVDYSQKILFILSGTSYGNGYENKGYFVLGDGSKCFFDLSEEERKYANIENLYQYLSSHLSEYERMAYLSSEEVKECIAYLYEVDEKSEIKEETAYFDGEQNDLYGVRFASETPEFVLLKGIGSLWKERPDENVGKIIKILDVEWADRSDYLRRQRKAFTYKFSGDEVVTMFVTMDITEETDAKPAILLVYADGSVEAGFGDYGAILTESGLKRQEIERYLTGRSKLGNLEIDDEKGLLHLICSLDTESITEEVARPFGEPQIEPTRVYYRFCVQWNKEGATYVMVNQGDNQKGITSQIKDDRAKSAVELVVDGAFMEAWYDMQY